MNDTDWRTPLSLIASYLCRNQLLIRFSGMLITERVIANPGVTERGQEHRARGGGR